MGNIIFSGAGRLAGQFGINWMVKGNAKPSFCNPRDAAADPSDAAQVDLYLFAAGNANRCLGHQATCRKIADANFTFFVCLLNDMAEALLFCDLVDNCLDGVSQIDDREAKVAKELFPEGYEVIKTS